jgi:MFS transporter, FHS family, Na+ dependent glucose transporter 1
MPWIKVYWLAMCMFLIQGVAQAVYDVGGNSIILRLWDGISDSPVNAMHAGYGIGAMLSVSIVLPFIKVSGVNEMLNDTLTNETNQTEEAIELTSDDIKLQIPYSIAGSLGALILICFLVAQYFELKNSKKLEKEKLKNQQEMSLKPLNDNLNELNKNSSVPLAFVQKLLFGSKTYSKSSLSIVLIQVFVIFLFFASASGVNNVLTAFLRTYLTLGPAKFTNAQYSTLASSYWIFFTIGRFGAALIAFKMNSILFFSLLILSNLITLGLFCIPYFSTWKQFYFIAISILGVTSGPLVPR